MVALGRGVGERAYTLTPGRYVVEVFLPEAGSQLQVVDLEAGTEALVELKLSANELQERDTVEPFGASPPKPSNKIRILNALQFADAISVPPQGRVTQVTQLDEYQVFSIEPGRVLSWVELRTPRGRGIAVMLPARGDQKNGSHRCWLTVRGSRGALEVAVRLGHGAADAAARYLDAGRLEDAIAVIQSPLYRNDETGDPFRIALAGYAHLRYGDIDQARVRAEKLVNEYGWLPDGFAMLAEIHAREARHEKSAALFESCISHGLPVFKDGLSALVSRTHRYFRDSPAAAGKGASPGLAEALALAPYVDWGKVVLTLSGWPFATADKKEGELDWTGLDRIDYTDEALPDTFLFPAGAYTASMLYTERKPRRPVKYQSLEREQLIQAYRIMYTSRRLDDREIVLKRQNRIFFQVSCAGHEAVQTAAALVLRPGKDWVFTYYRDRALCLGLGLRPLDMLRQAVGAATDTSGGRQMPCDFTAPQLHLISNPGAVGANFTQATGCAQAGRMLDPSSDDIVVVSSGEGGVAEGEFWEALNAACLEALPVLFLIQDNGYAISLPVAAQIAGGDIGNLVRSFPKLLVKRVDGTDLMASWQALQEAVSWCRQKRGPALVHAEVVRLYSHSLSDDERMYKTKDQREAESARDPVPGFAAWLTGQEFLSEVDLRGIEHEVEAEIQSATEQALREDSADPSQNDRYLYSEAIDPSGQEFEAEPLRAGEPITMVDAINRTLADEMSRDSRIVVFGEDVADLSDETKLDELKGKGGAFKVTYGLQRRFGSARCFNTPVTESAIVGRAIGMALRGLKPVVEIQFVDNIWRAMLQIRNELAATRWRSFNSYSAPVIVRVPLGGYLNGGAAFHSQSGEVAFTHIPGLRVAMPSTAADAAGLLRTALRCDDPVLFLEHKRLYREAYNRGAYPGPDFTIPFGRAKLVKPGSSLTIVTYGALVQKSVTAAAMIERQRPQSSIEVIDLRSLAPYDWNAIVLSVTKTARVMIAHEDWKSWGYGAELAARIARELFGQLDAPVGRVAAADRWIGYYPGLEAETLPQVEGLVAEAEKILDY
jgi:2-oxoisovalerate dehydrogenase E1 component